MFEPVLELKDVVKYYGDTAVLDGISFRVYHGETKIIIGASGSGKSTILKLIMGLDKPDSGKILVDGEEIRSGLSGIGPDRGTAEDRNGIPGVGAV